MASLTESIGMLRVHLELAEKELAALVGGKRVAAGRLRKHLQQLKTVSHDLRKKVIEHSKALPVKKRVVVPLVAEEPVAEPVVEDVLTAIKPVVKRLRASKKSKMVEVEA